MHAEALEPRTVQLTDISRGGTSFATDWQAATGTDVTLRFRAEALPVPARMVRCEKGQASVAFIQNPAALVVIDRILERLERERGQARAA